MFSIINLSPNLFDLIRKILVLPSNSLKNVKIWNLTIHNAGASMAACSEPGYSHLLDVGLERVDSSMPATKSLPASVSYWCDKRALYVTECASQNSFEQEGNGL